MDAQTLAKMPYMYIFNGDRTAASAKCYVIRCMSNLLWVQYKCMREERGEGSGERTFEQTMEFNYKLKWQWSGMGELS